MTDQTNQPYACLDLLGLPRPDAEQVWDLPHGESYLRFANDLVLSPDGAAIWVNTEDYTLYQGLTAALIGHKESGHRLLTRWGEDAELGPDKIDSQEPGPDLEDKEVTTAVASMTAGLTLVHLVPFSGNWYAVVFFREDIDEGCCVIGFVRPPDLGRRTAVVISQCLREFGSLPLLYSSDGFSDLEAELVRCCLGWQEDFDSPLWPSLARYDNPALAYAFERTGNLEVLWEADYRIERDLVLPLSLYNDQEAESARSGDATARLRAGLFYLGEGGSDLSPDELSDRAESVLRSIRTGELSPDDALIFEAACAELGQARAQPCPILDWFEKKPLAGVETDLEESWAP